MTTEIVTIYDELDRPSLVEVEVGSTRIVRVIESPKPDYEPESQASKHCDAGYMNDVRFGE